jgi:hypothetical protein
VCIRERLSTFPPTEFSSMAFPEQRLCSISVAKRRRRSIPGSSLRKRLLEYYGLRVRYALRMRGRKPTEGLCLQFSITATPQSKDCGKRTIFIEPRSGFFTPMKKWVTDYPLELIEGDHIDLWCQLSSTTRKPLTQKAMMWSFRVIKALTGVTMIPSLSFALIKVR